MNDREQKLVDGLTEIEDRIGKLIEGLHPKPLLADAQVGDVVKLRNGLWTQITSIASNGAFDYACANGHIYNVYGIHNLLSPDIISVEPLAAEGSAEWAWQMMLLGKIMTLDHDFIYRIDKRWEQEMRTSGDGEWHNCYLVEHKYKFLKNCHNESWQEYQDSPPDPKPYEVGDWVDAYGMQCKLISRPYPLHPENWLAKTINGNKENVDPRDIVRKIQPSEVKVKITLSGTVEPANGESFFLKHSSQRSGQYTMIRFADLPPDQANLVRELTETKGDEK